MKLWLRITFASTALILVVLIAVGLLLFLAEKRHLLANQYQEQDSGVMRLAQVCTESVAEQNDLILLNYVLSFKDNPGIRHASFISPQGKVIVHSDVSLVGRKLNDESTSRLLASPGILRQESDEDDIMEVGVPVWYQDENIGFARVSYDRGYYEDQIETALRSTMVRISYVCGIAIIIGFFGSVLFARGLTRPIKDLVHATEVIGKGELTHRSAVDRNDEIGALSVSFNDMASKLQALDELKSEFVSSVSHELRSPLTALRGFLQMFSLGITGPLNDVQKENVNVMMECTDRLGRFVNNILDVAKLEAGMIEFIVELVDPRIVANEIVTLFQPQAQLEKIQVDLVSPREVPKVQCDSDRLKQIFTNLISNALKFTSQGGRVTVWLRDDNGMVKMGVTDTGAGISQEDIPKLFNKFEQVKQTMHKAKGKGTGLGLTIVKRIVEGYGGAIGVESELTKGTTFFFTLPKAGSASPKEDSPLHAKA